MTDYPWNARGIFTVQLITIEVGHFSSLLFLLLLLSFLLSGRPACWNPKWFRSKVIICLLLLRRLLHGTVQSDLLYPSLLKKTRAPSGRPPLAFSRSPLDSLLAGFLFFFLPWCCSPTQTTSSPSRSTSYHGAWREFSLLLQPPPSLFFWRASGLLLGGTTLSSPHLFPPCAAPFSQVPLGRIIQALEIIFALPTHWVPLTVSLVSHLLAEHLEVVRILVP